MFGGDLPSNDDFTLSLLTNKEVLYVNQHSTNNKQLFNNKDLIAWTADDPKTGDKFLALFNATDKPKGIDNNATLNSDSTKISITFDQLGFKGKVTITDLWNHKNLGDFTNEFAPLIKRHGSGLYRVSVKK